MAHKLTAPAFIGRIDHLLHLYGLHVSRPGDPRYPKRKTWDEQRTDYLNFTAYRDAIYADLRRVDAAKALLQQKIKVANITKRR